MVEHEAQDPQPTMRERLAGLPLIAFGVYLLYGFSNMRVGMARRPPMDLPARVLCELIADLFAVLGAGALVVGFCYLAGVRSSILHRVGDAMMRKFGLGIFILLAGFAAAVVCYWLWPELVK
jgi:hypothetical protein